MFDKFTDHARRVLVLAQEEANALQHAELGTENLLIALMRLEDDLPARAMAKLGVPLETARKNVEKLQIPIWIQVLRGDRPFTAKAKKSLELALREALQLDHDFIGTEHLLLGIIRHDRDAVRVVYGVNPDTVRRTVTDLIIERDGLKARQATQPEEPVVRPSADILFDIEQHEEHLERLREELAEAQKRETGVDPQYHH